LYTPRFFGSYAWGGQKSHVVDWQRLTEFREAGNLFCMAILCSLQNCPKISPAAR